MANPEPDTDALCDRIDALDHDIHAFVPEPERRERLRAEAERLTEGPLHRIAVGIKDIIQVDGLPTRAGSALDPQVLGGPQASIVTRLRAAGALIAGKTVTAEFAVFAPNETRNPHDRAHTPGGSSSGSAAAVAAGMVPLAIGTQTIGSVIRPAAFCGIYGFKPTYGRIPTDGVIPNAPSFDTLGAFAADLAGIESVARVVCDGWKPVPAAGPPRLGIPDGPYLDNVESETLDAFETYVKSLQDTGVEVERIPAMVNFADLAESARIINQYELVQSHAEWFPRYGELYRTETVESIHAGQAISPPEYEAAQDARAAFRADIVAAMQDIDMWIAPSAPGPAPRGLETTGNPIMCMPWSYTGMPALNIPAGLAGNGLPLGVQVVGRPGTDEKLLRWAGLLPRA